MYSASGGGDRAAAIGIWRGDDGARIPGTSEGVRRVPRRLTERGGRTATQRRERDRVSAYGERLPYETCCARSLTLASGQGEGDDKGWSCNATSSSRSGRG